MTDEFEPRARTWPHESPPARAELDAVKAWHERLESVRRRMRNTPSMTAEEFCQMEDDLAALRVELRREREKR